MRVVVTGASGFVGSRVAQHLIARHEILGVVHTARGGFPFPCERADLTLDEPTGTLFREWKPEVIVHAAAMSRVIECERNPARARAANVEATARLIRLAERLHAKLIFISSDQVFSGKRGGYRESDNPDPIGEYGRTKLEAEREVLNSAARHLVLRSNSVVGPSMGWGESFSTRILDTIRRGEPLQLYGDQYRSPIHVRKLVQIIEHACISDMNGLLHIGGPKRMSRLDIGFTVLRAYGLSAEKVEPVSYLTHPDAAVMTRDTSYDISQLLQTIPDLRFDPLDDEFSRDSTAHKR
ncbi:SDR family oxidoreductase [bacterium]|nr:SDR family oxidoreductase [bacterium]MBU1984218.1 SDR family oxidoreductase [bacterium]